MFSWSASPAVKVSLCLFSVCFLCWHLILLSLFVKNFHVQVYAQSEDLCWKRNTYLLFPSLLMCIIRSNAVWKLPTSVLTTCSKAFQWLVSDKKLCYILLTCFLISHFPLCRRKPPLKKKSGMTYGVTSIKWHPSVPVEATGSSLRVLRAGWPFKGWEKWNKNKEEGAFFCSSLLDEESIERESPLCLACYCNSDDYHHPQSKGAYLMHVEFRVHYDLVINSSQKLWIHSWASSVYGVCSVDMVWINTSLMITITMSMITMSSINTINVIKWILTIAWGLWCSGWWLGQ